MKTYLKVNELGICEDQTNGFFEVVGVPDGWAELPEHLAGVWERCKPFASIEVSNGLVIAIEENPKAKAAWEAANPPTVPQIDPITQIQIAVAELAEAGAKRDIENKLAIAELAEAMTGGK